MTSYSPSDILGHKVRTSVNLRRLTRNEMLTRLQVLRTLDPIVEKAYRSVEEANQRNGQEAPHGDPWHVSFHASQFPGDEKSCPRAALYRLMDFAREGSDHKAVSLPFDRKSRTIMAAGKAIEVELVQTFADAGILLSAKPQELQTQFEFPVAWLTGSVDSVIRWNDTGLVPVEVKTKYQAALDEMKLGKRGPDIAHIFQLKVQLALIYLYQASGARWADFDRVDHGYILYLSRDKPSDTAEFRVDLDLKFFSDGIERLKRWKQFFLDDVLPEFPKGKRTNNFGHPMGAVGLKWSELPCAWCPHKRTCQLDFRQSTTALSESVGVDRTRVHRPEYDPNQTRAAVLKRWEESDVPDKDTDRRDPAGVDSASR